MALARRTNWTSSPQASELAEASISRGYLSKFEHKNIVHTEPLLFEYKYNAWLTGSLFNMACKYFLSCVILHMQSGISPKAAGCPPGRISIIPMPIPRYYRPEIVYGSVGHVTPASIELDDDIRDFGQTHTLPVALNRVDISISPIPKAPVNYFEMRRWLSGWHWNPSCCVSSGI